MAVTMSGSYTITVRDYRVKLVFLSNVRLGYVVAMETESPLPECSRCKELECHSCMAPSKSFVHGT